MSKIFRIHVSRNENLRKVFSLNKYVSHAKHATFYYFLAKSLHKNHTIHCFPKTWANLISHFGKRKCKDTSYTALKTLNAIENNETVFIGNMRQVMYYTNSQAFVKINPARVKIDAFFLSLLSQREELKKYLVLLSLTCSSEEGLRLRFVMDANGFAIDVCLVLCF
jgi:hypothetical protein